MSSTHNTWVSASLLAVSWISLSILMFAFFTQDLKDAVGHRGLSFFDNIVSKKKNKQNQKSEDA